MGLRKLNRAMNPGTTKRRQRFYRKEFPSGITTQDYWTWQATLRGYFGSEQTIMAINKATRAGLRVPNRQTKGD